MTLKTHTLIVTVTIFMSALFGKENAPNLPRTNAPKRIVSLGSALTEQIFLLEKGKELVANTTYCTRPQEAKSVYKIGDVTTLNLEKIVSLKPDLVLATGLTHPNYLEKLTQLKVPHLRINFPTNYTDFIDQFLLLGGAIGATERARVLAANCDKEVQEIQSRLRKAKPKTVFFQIGSNPIFAVVGNTFLNDYILFSGGANIAQNEKSGSYSREKVLLANPDFIFVTAMGLESNTEIKEWKKFSSLKAVKNNQIIVLDSYESCSPTPVTFVKTLRTIATHLHPTLMQ